MKKIFCAAILLIFLVGALASCSTKIELSYDNDGTFVGRSSEDDKGAYGEVTLEIKDGKVVSCDYVTWKKDGTVKDETYGMVNGEIENKDYYAKAQLAVDAMQKYAEELVDKQDINEVDAVSGATNSYDQFLEAVQDALKSEG
jgi:major membrane immunogen (membrane-anchored lipoprotein)